MYTNCDPDTLLKTSSGYCEIIEEKSPTGGYRGWFYYVIKYRDGSVVQVITPDNGISKDFYFRKGFNNSGTIEWTGWSLLPYDIPSFYKDYGSLTSLATALGVGISVGYIYNIVGSNDANLFLGRTMYGMTDQETLNTPEGYYGFLINFDCGGTAYPGFGVQFWFSISNSDASFYYRTNWNDWSSWKKLSRTS